MDIDARNPIPEGFEPNLIYGSLVIILDEFPAAKRPQKIYPPFNEGRNDQLNYCTLNFKLPKFTFTDDVLLKNVVEKYHKFPSKLKLQPQRDGKPDSEVASIFRQHLLKGK